jgi:nucleotide-binding universal stress UspA family protein
MFARIIVGHDLREGGEDALALARALVGATGAELVVAGVFPYHDLPGHFEGRWHKEGEEVARELQAIADGAGARAEAYPSSSPARGLHDLAEEIEADLIIVGSSHRGRVGHALAGDVGQALMHGSPCAVAIAPHGYCERALPRIDSVVVGSDGSPEASEALLEAIELARANDVRLNLVAVAEPPFTAYGNGGGGDYGWRTLKNAVEEMTRKRLDEAISSVPDDIRCHATLVSGNPAKALAEAGRSPGVVLMLGSRAYGPVRRVLLGSVSSALVRSAPCPLIVHPRGAGVSAQHERAASHSSG